MKNIILLAFFSCCLNTVCYTQINPSATSNHQQVSTTAQEVQLPPATASKNVLNINGSTYKNACERRGGQYVSDTGCANLERAWKRGQLFNCTNPPGKIPYDSSETFKCYSSNGEIIIEIIKAPQQIDTRERRLGYK
ncbi:MAG: hypothetical protein AB8G22_20195 [Saprospiraceae bacterium]